MHGCNITFIHIAFILCRNTEVCMQLWCDKEPSVGTQVILQSLVTKSPQLACKSSCSPCDEEPSVGTQIIWQSLWQRALSQYVDQPAVPCDEETSVGMQDILQLLWWIALSWHTDHLAVPVIKSPQMAHEPKLHDKCWLPDVSSYHVCSNIVTVTAPQ